jgi:hypothetical protein
LRTFYDFLISNFSRLFLAPYSAITLVFLLEVILFCVVCICYLLFVTVMPPKTKKVIQDKENASVGEGNERPLDEHIDSSGKKGVLVNRIVERYEKICQFYDCGANSNSRELLEKSATKGASDVRFLLHYHTSISIHQFHYTVHHNTTPHHTTPHHTTTPHSTPHTTSPPHPHHTQTTAYLNTQWWSHATSRITRGCGTQARGACSTQRRGTRDCAAPERSSRAGKRSIA